MSIRMSPEQYAELETRNPHKVISDTSNNVRLNGKLPIVITMPYIGSVLSVNHYKFGRYTRPEVKRWMVQLGYAINIKRVDWTKVKLPLIVTCSGTFKDKRYPDLSNLSKVILDSIEDITHINDKHMRWHDGEVTFSDNPELKIVICDSSNNTPVTLQR